MAGHKGGG